MPDNIELILLGMVIVIYMVVLVEAHGFKAMIARFIKQDKDRNKNVTD